MDRPSYASPTDHTRLQRAALREVLQLAPEHIQPAEEEIADQYTYEQNKVRKAAEELGEKLQKRYQKLSRTIEQRHAKQLQDHEIRFSARLAEVDAEYKHAKRRIKHEADTVLNEAKKTRDQALWLAESVAEAARNRVKKTYQKTRKDVPKVIEKLDSIRQQADWLLQEYGHTLPEETTFSGEESASGEGAGYAVTAHACLDRAEQLLNTLSSLQTPRLFIGVRPYVIGGLLCLVAVGAVGLITLLNLSFWPAFWVTGPIAGAAVAVALVFAAKTLRRNARVQIDQSYYPLRQAIETAKAALDQQVAHSEELRKQQEIEAAEARGTEIRAAHESYEAVASSTTQRAATALHEIEEKYKRKRSEVEAERESELAKIEEEHLRSVPALRERYDRYQSMLCDLLEHRSERCHNRREHNLAALAAKWNDGLARIQELMDDSARLYRGLCRGWDDPGWAEWTPVRDFAPAVRFGQIHVDFRQMADRVRSHAPFREESTLVPAMLEFSDRCSLLVQYDRNGRDAAIGALRSVMARLLTSLPPGRVHFTIIDPVGLGENFAGFMHLVDYDEAMVNSRIWTDPNHIEQRLSDLTGHMENVIQKYLRNEFATIDEYNEQAGELAEPYRYLVIADFPANCNEESAKRLASVVSSGARCGVYTLIAHDMRQSLPPGFAIEDVAARSVHLICKNDRFIWQDEVFRRFPVTLDSPPAEDQLTRLMHVIGKAAMDAKRVEVPFEIISPPVDRIWSGDAGSEVSVPIGRAGATRLQHLKLGRGMAQHTLIAGKTGSGKSTLLHVIVTNLAMWYSPDEVEFYLVDFKKGVEFKTYAVHDLPHARAVAIESDREFGLSVLQRLDAEMERRGEMFRKHGVQDLPAYRKASGARLPRTFLIVDEFQMFFSEDDKLAQDASLLLDRLVRQGRAFGIHVILGSQTLGGTSGLARSTIGQMAVRIALQCSEADSQLILDDSNSAARLLTRPGEAIYNDAGGLIEGNSPFQTSWLSDEQRDGCLDCVVERNRQRTVTREPLIVFEGNAAADLRKNYLLSRLLEAPAWGAGPASPRVWLGDPVAIKEPTAAVLPRQSGANMLLVGQRDDAALAILESAVLSLAMQYSPRAARFIVLDGTPVDSPLAGEFYRVTSSLPHEVRMVEWRDVADAIHEVAEELKRRQEKDQTDAPAVYLIINALQRYRMLRRREDEFSFSRDEEAETSRPDRELTDLLREGPVYGIHVLTWADTQATIERTLDRQAMREFDNRVLFQMSASDSSNLIDSPAANRLGFYRAMFYSEQQGLLEKFRPYASPDPVWLSLIAERLRSRG